MPYWPPADSSTVTMPPSPTVCRALPMTRPTTSSSLAEMAATRAKSSSDSTGRATSRRCSTSRATARSMPRLTSTGLAPAPIAAMPSRTIAWARTVAVVVPSPTMSLVLMAASLTSCAPMFSNWSLRWISRAIVTPSLVTTGEPVIFSRMTLRPLGPRVVFTASASWSTPACRRVRASGPKRSSFAMVGLRSRYEDRAAAYAARVEIADRFHGGVQRVRLGVQRDLARLGEDHQLGKVGVRADDVADDVAFGGDDVQRRDLDRAAVADHEVRAGRPRHREAVLLGALLGDEVEHDVGALALGEVLDRGDLVTVADHGVIRAQLLGELEGVRVAVDHDDLRRGQRGQALDADMPEAAGPDDDRGRARREQRYGLAHGVVRGDAGVGERGDVLRLG